MNRDQKSNLVSLLRSKLSSSSFVAIIHYRGMNEKQLYKLRTSLKSKGCSMVVAKNTLAKIAISGTELESLSPYLVGPTAILYSADPVALSKAVSDIAAEVEHLKIKIGFFNNSLLDSATIKQMASLGSLEDVRSSFIRILTVAQSNFVRIIDLAVNELKDRKD